MFSRLFFPLVLKSALNKKEEVSSFCVNMAKNCLEDLRGEVDHKFWALSFVYLLSIPGSCHSFFIACFYFTGKRLTFSDCKLPYDKQASGFIIIVSSATYHSVVGPFVHWADYSRYIDPGTLCHCLVISVNCEIRIFLWQFQSIGRPQVPLPISRREKNLIQCFLKKWTQDSYRMELSYELMLSS